MYEANGIDLTQTEIDELRFALAHPAECSDAVRRRTEADTTLTPAYRVLHERKLVECQIAHGDVVIWCEPLRAASDWIAAYEESERDRKRLSRREWGMIAVNLGGGAALGGIVSLVLRSCFGI